MARTPRRKSTAKPDVDAKEPKAQVQTSDDATDTGASGGDDTTVNDADNAGGGDGVTGKTNDGATMASRDGATGTPNAKSAQISTKEGDAPQGDERDTGFTDTADAGPGTQAEAAFGSAMPAGTFVGRQAVGDVTKELTSLLQKFATKDDDREAEEVRVSGGSNIHDDLHIQRAEILDLAAEVEETFGIDITPSEAQNFLLVRDIGNLVLRKLAANQRQEENRRAREDA